MVHGIFPKINIQNEKNSMAFSPQANYTDWATAAYRQS
jgi:hypothetical protein